MRDSLPGSGDPKYWAFVSYSHSDRRWGEWLHRSLETYKIPERLVGSIGRHGERVPARIYPVFRDRAELPSSSNLGQEIETALAGSRSLVVICSPRSARSAWVEEEIFRFKAFGREERTFGLIIEGRPFASESRDPSLECFPRAFRTRIGPDGALTDERLEPNAADARPEGDGRRDALLRLVAAIVGVGFDDLKRRDQARERKRLRNWLIATLALTVLFAALAGLAFWQRERALHTLSRSDGDQALRRLEDGDARGALAFLARAVRSDPDNSAARERLGALLVQRLWPVPERALQSQEVSFYSAGWSPDGRLLATGDLAGVVQLWDATTGHPRKQAFSRSTTGFAHEGAVQALVFSPDGRFLATAGSDGFVRLWRLDGRLAWASASLGGAVRDLSFSYDGSRLAAASGAPYVSLWQVAPGPGSEQRIPLPAAALSVSFDRSGTRLVIGCQDNSVRLWGLSTSRLLASFDEEAPVAAAELSPDGGRLLTGAGYYGSWTVRLRNLTDGTIVWSAAHPLPEPAEPIGPSGYGEARFSPDGSRVLSIFTLDRSVRLWNAENGALATEPASHNALLRTAHFSPDGHRLVTIAGDNQARLWRVPPSRPDHTRRIGKDEQVVSATLLPGGHNGAVVLASAEDRWRLAVLDLRQEPKLLAERPLTGRAFLRAVDSRRVAVEMSDGAVQIFDGTTLEPLVRTAPGSAVGAAALSHEALWIGREDGTVQHIPLDDPGKARTEKLPPAAQDIKSLAVDPTSQNLILGTFNGKVFLWPQSSAEPLQEIGHHDLTVSLALAAPGGKFVTGGYDGQVRRWRGNGEPIAPSLRQSAELIAGALSSEGNILITCARDDTARWWNIKDAVPLAAPVRLSSWCTSIVPAPSSEGFLIGDQKGTLRLHSLATALPLADPIEEIGEIRAFGWHGDSMDALTILADGRMRRFPLRLPVEAERVTDLSTIASALSDLRLNEQGGVELKEPSGRSELLAILDRLPARSALRPLLEWLVP